MGDSSTVTGEVNKVRYQDEHVQFEEYIKESEDDEEDNGKQNKIRKMMNKDRAFQEFARKYY